MATNMARGGGERRVRAGRCRCERAEPSWLGRLGGARRAVPAAEYLASGATRPTARRRERPRRVGSASGASVEGQQPRLEARAAVGVLGHLHDRLARRRRREHERTAVEQAVVQRAQRHAVLDGSRRRRPDAAARAPHRCPRARADARLVAAHGAAVAVGAQHGVAKRRVSASPGAPRRRGSVVQVEAHRHQDLFVEGRWEVGVEQRWAGSATSWARARSVATSLGKRPAGSTARSEVSVGSALLARRTGRRSRRAPTGRRAADARTGYSG